MGPTQSYRETPCQGGCICSQIDSNGRKEDFREVAGKILSLNGLIRGLRRAQSQVRKLSFHFLPGPPTGPLGIPRRGAWLRQQVGGSGRKSWAPLSCSHQKSWARTRPPFGPSHQVVMAIVEGGEMEMNAGVMQSVLASKSDNWASKLWLSTWELGDLGQEM